MSEWHSREQKSEWRRAQRQRRLRRKVADFTRHLRESLTEEEQAVFGEWLLELLEIRSSHLGVRERVIRALRATARRKTVLTILRTTGRPLVRVAWRDRSWKQRLAWAGIGVAVFVGIGQQAGLALMGTAFAVPLWVVFGSGGVVAGWILDGLVASDPPVWFRPPFGGRRSGGAVA